MMKKLTAIFVSVCMLLTMLPTLAGAKSAQDYAADGESLAVIANGTVDMHGSMRIEGSIFTTGTVRVDDAGGNVIQGKFISPTEGMELIYWEGNPDTYFTEGYELYNAYGGNVTAYSAKPQYDGAVLDKDAAFDYTVKTPLFTMPQTNEYDYDKLEANEYSNTKREIDEDTAIRELTVVGDALTVNAESNPVNLLIDTLTMENDMARITVKGDQPVNLYVNQFNAGNGKINVKWEAPSAENGWSGREAACSDQVTIFTNSALEMGAGVIAADMYIHADRINISGSSAFYGHIITDAPEVILQGQIQTRGVIKAPYADVQIKQGARVYGQLIANTLDINGMGEIHYQQDIVDEFEELPDPEAPVIVPTPTPEATPEPTPEATVPPYTEPIGLSNNSTYLFGRAQRQLAPDEYMLRGEACSVLYRLLRQNHALGGFRYDESAEPAFRDISGRWDRSAIEYMVYRGVYQSSPQTGIGPVQEITRGEAFKLFCLALGFTDDAALSYEQYTMILQDAGYVIGDENGELNIDENITRGAFCKIYNMITGRDMFVLQTADGEPVTAETYGIADISDNWAYDVMLRATSAFNADGYVDVSARGQRSELDDYIYQHE